MKIRKLKGQNITCNKFWFKINPSLLYIYRLQSIRIRKLSEALNTNNMDFVKFIDEIFNYDSSKRLTPTEALCHIFFAPLFPFTLFYTNHAIDSVLKKTSI